MSEEAVIIISVTAIILVTTVSCFAMFLGLYYLYRNGKGVTCTDSSLLEASEADVLERSMVVLRRGQRTYRYVDTVVSDDGRCIETRIRPMSWPLLLSTALRIELDYSDGMTRITVTTQSQKYIRGDAFGFYVGYIQDFLGAVSGRT